MGRSRSKDLRLLVLNWLPVLAFAGVILFIGSSKAIPLSYVDIPLHLLLLRKAIHVGEYAILGFLLYRGLTRRARTFSLRYALLVLLLSLAFASIDEWRQMSLPMRSGVIADVGIDAIGVGVGLVFAKLSARTRLNS